MVISVSEKVHSGGHGEGGSESNKGEQGIAYLIHLCKKCWGPEIKLPCGGGGGGGRCERRAICSLQGWLTEGRLLGLGPRLEF